MLALVGMPGSGKSTVGRQIARRIGCDFIDSDQVIEQRLGCSIKEYFERQGEAAFRDVESQTLEDITRQAGCVLATGGGAGPMSSMASPSRPTGLSSPLATRPPTPVVASG